MHKKHPVLWLAVLTMTTSPGLLAHNAGSDIDRHKAERRQAEEKQDREAWDDFMNAVRQQETKTGKSQNTTEETGQKKATRH